MLDYPSGLESRPAVLRDLAVRFGADTLVPQSTHDAIPTAWSSREHVRGVLRYLKTEIEQPFRTLYDLTAH
jgi:NADH-quinone oxidoreductase subunit C/D